MKKAIIIIILLLLAGPVSAEIIITLNEPTNNYYSKSQSINFTATINSLENITNASIYGNFSQIWMINETNNSIEGNETELFITLTLDDGSYEWNIEACDINDLCTFSDNNFTINVDTQIPQQITIINTTTNESAQINITTNEPSNYTINYGEDENIELQEINTTYIESHEIIIENLSSSTTYFYQIISCDEAGNCNTTQILNFTTQETTDNEPPTWNETPYDFTINNETNIAIQYNATDNTQIDQYFINDQENFTITPQGLLTNATNLQIQIYNLAISVNDTTGNTATQTITINITEIYIDQEPPTWNQTPYNFTINNETNIAIQYNATDNIERDTFYINDTTNFNMLSSGLLTNKTTLNSGNYSLLISVNDTSGNVNSTNINIEIISIITAISPSVTSVVLSSYVFSNNTAIEINVTVQKGTYDLDTVTVFGVELNNLTDKNAETIVWTGLVNLNDNYMNATAIATDTESYTSTKNSANYIINDTPPIIISIDPESPSTPVYFSSDVYFTFTANKNVTGNFILDEDYQVNFTNSKPTHSFTLNGSINRSILPAGVLTNGLHNITIYLEDEYENTAIINHAIQIIDNTPPRNLTKTITGTSTSSSSGTATITITLNEYANCWISSSSSISAETDGNMSQHTLMTGSPGKTLTRTISYSSSTTITRYISCRDLLDNSNNGNEEIEFTVTISSSDTGGTTNSDPRPRPPRIDDFSDETNAEIEDEEIYQEPILKNITRNEIITITRGEDIRYNENLRKIISEILGYDEIDDLLAEEFIKKSEEITKNIEITREIKIIDNTTTIITTIKNTGDTNLSKIMIYDRIPRQFATSVNNITTTIKDALIKVVKENPEYLIIYNELLPGQEKSYSYLVLERKNPEIVEMFSTEIYTELNIKTVEPQKDSNAEKIIGIIIWLQIIWIAAFLFYYKKHHSRINKNNKKII